MQGRAVCLAAAIAAFATAASAADMHLAADGYLVVRVGERIVAHFDPGGRIVVDEVGQPQPDSGKPNDAEADHIVVTFTSGGAMPGTNLVVKSGYQTGFNYHARMRRGSRTAPTSVCAIVPHGMAFENWQFQLDAVEVGGFTPAGLDDMRCQ